MAVIGQALASPETGWRRYDDTLGSITYVNTWQTYSDSNQSGGSMKWTQVVGASAEFKFKGTKLRIIGRHYSDRSETNTVIIDGVSYTFSQRSATVEKALSFEVLNLSNTTHTVKIVAGDTGTASGKLSIDAIDIDDTGYILTIIGQPLTSPEQGWRRYEESDGRFAYTGNWNSQSLAMHSGGTMKYTGDAGANVKFKFYGTKLRIIVNTFTASDTTTNVTVDGVDAIFSTYSATDMGSVLIFETTNLPLALHSVTITKGDSNTSKLLRFDAIDIDDTGKLVHPYLTERTSLLDMQIGDVISCEYVGASGVAGTFSNLGTATKNLLPTVAGASANGSFYFIMVGKEPDGKIKLIADRNLQHSITWTVLDTAGYTLGTTRVMSSNLEAELYIRLLNGGTSSSDMNHEWQKIMLESTLGGKITAGDQKIWNMGGHYCYTNTVYPGVSYYRVIYGYPPLTYYTYSGSNVIDTTVAWRPVLLVKVLNIVPDIEIVSNTSYTFDSDIRLTGSISDRDATDLISYKVVVNGVTLSDWSANSPSPITVDVTVPVSMLTLSSNTIVISATDGRATSTKSYTAYKKLVDSTYLLGSTNYNGEATIKVSVSGIAFIKIPDVIRTRGYIRTASLMVDMISGGGSGGSIKVAPIRSDWSGSTVSTLNQPSVDTANAVDVSIPLNNGQVSMDITQVIKRVWNQPSGYGIAIYTTEYPIEFSVLGINVDYQYQATELDQPYVVYGNRVTLNWKPLILERDDAFKKIILLRSTSSDFSSATQVFETPDKSILTFTDTTITKGKAFYSIKVEQLDFPFSGSKIDFDLADEPSFIQQDATNGTDFEGGVVMLKHYPSAVVSNPMSESTGITFDSTKVEVTGGLVKLKQTT